MDLAPLVTAHAHVSNHAQRRFVHSDPELSDYFKGVMSGPIEVCLSCHYPKTDKGCETPGCMESIWMTGEVRQRREVEAEAQADRDRIDAIRSRVLDQVTGKPRTKSC
jgi:hypothetical protein